MAYMQNHSAEMSEEIRQGESTGVRHILIRSLLITVPVLLALLLLI